MANTIQVEWIMSKETSPIEELNNLTMLPESIKKNLSSNKSWDEQNCMILQQNLAPIFILREIFRKNKNDFLKEARFISSALKYKVKGDNPDNPDAQENDNPYQEFSEWFYNPASLQGAFPDNIPSQAQCMKAVMWYTNFIIQEGIKLYGLTPNEVKALQWSDKDLNLEKLIVDKQAQYANQKRDARISLIGLGAQLVGTAMLGYNLYCVCLDIMEKSQKSEQTGFKETLLFSGGGFLLASAGYYLGHIYTDNAKGEDYSGKNPETALNETQAKQKRREYSEARR